MCAEKSRAGRPKIYDSAAEKKRAERARIKAAGCREVRLSLPEEYKAQFDKFCAENKLAQVEGFCYLLDLFQNFSDSSTQACNKVPADEVVDLRTKEPNRRGEISQV